MSGKKTLIWLVILAALGAFYYFYEVEGEKKRQEATRQRELLLNFAADAVTGFTIQREQDTIRANKRDGRWFVTEPLATPGDEQKYRELVRSVADLRYTRIIAEQPQKLDIFGLEPPQLQIQVTLQEGATPLSLRLGAANPTGSGYYAQVEGRPAVYLVSSSAKDTFNASLHDVRDKTVLAFTPADVQEIRIGHGDAVPAVLQRQEAEQWQMTEPVQAKADNQQVRSVIQRLQEAKVQSFIAEEAADRQPYGLHAPTLQITLTVGAERVQHTLRLGQESADPKGIYAQRGNTSQVLLLSREFWKGLPTTIAGWRDKTLLQYDREQVTRLQIKTPEHTIEVARSGVRQYMLEQPLATAGDSETIFSLLWDLKELKAKDIVADAPASLQPYGLEAPRLQITATVEPPNQTAVQHTLWLGEETATGVYAMMPERATVYLVDTIAAKRFLDLTVFMLQNKKVLAFTPEQIQKIQVQYPETRLVIERRGKDWQLLEPEKHTIAQRWKVDNLLQELSTVNYAKIVTEAPGDSALYGFDAPQVQLHLWQQNGTPIGPLILGKTSNTEVADTPTVYAQVGSAAPVYALHGDVLKDIPKSAADFTTP